MFECFADDPALQLAVKRNAEVVSHHEWDEDRARRLDVFRYVRGDGDGDGRDASLFNGALHERDALMANRSSGRQQRHVRAFGDDLFG